MTDLSLNYHRLLEIHEELNPQKVGVQGRICPPFLYNILCDSFLICITCALSFHNYSHNVTRQPSLYTLIIDFLSFRETISLPYS